MTSSPRPWTATGRGWAVSWSPLAPHLEGSGPRSSSVISAIVAALAKVDEIRLTPTSAAVPANTAEPAAVLAALNRCGRSFTLTGAPPTFPSEPGLVY